MREIPLGRSGMVAIVDDEDYNLVSQWKWYAAKEDNTAYAIRRVRVGKGRDTVWMHRLINNTPDGLVTDHINGNGLDNRKCNLRQATHQQNMVNNKRWKGNSSGHRGISWHKGNKKWYAQITVNYKNLYIGSFKKLEDAVNAYKEKVKDVRRGQIIRMEEPA